MLNTTPGASAFTIHDRATVSPIAMHFNGHEMLLWVFITALNLYVTITISLRLCMAQRRTHTIPSRSLYKSIAIIFVECDALFTMCSVAMLILFPCNYKYAHVSVGFATEVAVRFVLVLLLQALCFLRIDHRIHRLRPNCSSLHGTQC